MTIDERLDAVTMNLELTARDVADLQKAVAVMQQSTEEFKRSTEDFKNATAARFAHWEMEKQHLDDKVDSLATSTQMLLTAVQAQQVRSIERVERR